MTRLLCRSLRLPVLIASSLFLLLAGRSAWAQPAPDRFSLTPAAAASAAMATPEEAPPAPPPEEVPLSFGGGSTTGGSLMFTSAYIWRGFVESTGGSLQPSFWVAAKGFTVTSWTNGNLASGKGGVNEHDFTVAYDHEFSRATVQLSWINYALANLTQGRFSNEVATTVTLDAPLSPYVLVTHDFQLGDGNYVAVGVSHAFPVPHTRIGGNATMSLGYNDHLWREKSGMSELTTTVTFEVPVVTHTYLAPFVTYSHGFDSPTLPRKAFGGVSLVIR